MNFFKSFVKELLPYIVVLAAVISFELIVDFGWINLYYILLFALGSSLILLIEKIRWTRVHRA